uniref:Uncharacterized protein n=1 Tax=Spodoptera littoralis nuclear polyhedrosis virus TaxID=10456 RepID=A0A3G4S8X4_NPVSL|nr:hypothetical protein [Spodoptera littoralis nucleopolyhedrovirus]
MNQHFKSNDDIFVGPVILCDGDENDLFEMSTEMSDDIIMTDHIECPSIADPINFNLLCDDVQIIEPIIDVVDVSDGEDTTMTKIKLEENMDVPEFMMHDTTTDAKNANLFDVALIEKLEFDEPKAIICNKCADINSPVAFCRCPMTDEKMKILKNKMMSFKFVHRLCLLNVIGKVEDLKDFFKPIDVERATDDELKTIAKIYSHWYRLNLKTENSKVFFRKLPDGRQKLESLVDSIYRGQYEILMKNFIIHKEDFKFMYYIKSICNTASEYDVHQWLDIFNFSTWNKVTMYRFYTFINSSNVKAVNCYNRDQLQNLILKRLQFIKMSKNILTLCSKRAEALFVQI